MPKINTIHREDLMEFEGFMNSVLKGLVSSRVYNALILQSYPGLLSEEEDRVRKILARHGDPTIYGTSCVHLDEEFDVKLLHEAEILQKDTEEKRKKNAIKNKQLREYTRWQAIVKRDPIGSFLAMFTTEIIKKLNDDELIVYAFLFHMNTKDAPKKARAFYAELFRRVIPELQKRSFPIEIAEIQKLYSGLSQEVRTQVSRAMRF